jgi:hypothetical protein
MLTFIIVFTMTLGKVETVYTFSPGKELYNTPEACDAKAVEWCVDLVNFAESLGATGVTSRKCFIPDYRDT